MLPAPLPDGVSLESGPRLPPKPLEAGFLEALWLDRWETKDTGLHAHPASSSPVRL